MRATNSHTTAGIDAAEVQRQLDLPARMIGWLREVDRPADAPSPALPNDDEASHLLERLAVEPPDRIATIAARPDPDAHPALWWVLDRAHHDVLASMGEPPAGIGWPAVPVATGPVGRHLFIWLCLAVVPAVRRYHADHNVSEEISWASLSSLGAELSKTRELTGVSGLGPTWGLPRAFGGTSFRLGRLAFDRALPQPDPSDHPVLRPGQSGLNTHVPRDGGPLSPDACDDSFARAREFFPARFPEHVVSFGCHSWLMDDQLASFLPDSSNIIRFQRRFTRFTDRQQADRDVLEHLFRRRYEEQHVPSALLDELPQRTTLDRAVVAHLREGRHWYNQTGWFTL